MVGEELVALCTGVRFTSARAERTVVVTGRSVLGSVHLRSRGEDFTIAVAMRSICGSPPLARRGLYSP